MVTSLNTNIHTVGVSSDPYSLHITTGSFYLGTAAGISKCWEQFQSGHREGRAMLPVWHVRVENVECFPTPGGRHPFSHPGETERERENSPEK